jgi:peptidoglycan hydrolase CwlO-like protein
MALLKRLIVLPLLLLTPLFFFVPVALADECPTEISQARVDCLNQKYADAQSQVKTLASQVDSINAQIALTRSRIDLTQDKLDRLADSISSASGKIGLIEDSLAHVSTVLANRITQTYIAGRVDPLFYLLSSSDFSDFFQRFDYLRLAQKHDKTLMLQMAATRKNYQDQKVLLEDKKKQEEVLSAQLKTQKIQLDRQNVERQALLTLTKNDEARYSQLRADAQRELDAIKTSQFSGKRDVKRGDVIGFMGNTGYSFGAHLHFGVYNLREADAGKFDYASNTDNPFNYLKNKGATYAGSSCYDTPGSIGSGNWDWPMNDIIITQCYGRTPVSAYLYAGGIHYGVDMSKSGGDIAVRAVDDGVAYSYRGTSSLGNNVRIFHSNGKMTLYLHLQ